MKDRNEQLEACLQQYTKLILTICYSMTGDYFEAEDLTQETFLSAYQNFDRFDGKNLKGWLTTIAANKCRDHLKSAARRIKPAVEEQFSQMADTAPDPEEATLREDSEKRMRLLCRRLKEPYAGMAVRHFCEGKQAGQIAEETGKNIKTVQTQIYRARAMLKSLWKEEYR